jgi:sorbitol-specific phosphotransferase system component IIBC
MRIPNSAKALGASVSALWLLILLWVLRQFSILGSEYDILVNCVSAIGLVLLGVFVGILISEKKIQIRSTLPFLFVFTAGFFAAPFIAVGSLMLTTKFSFSQGIEPLIFGGSITGYLLLYMLFWFWLKNKDVVKLGETA